MLYTIENKKIKVTVSDMGAEMTSLILKKTGVEYLWQGDPTYWTGHAYNLFPICGRLWEGKYTYQGNTYYAAPMSFIRDNATTRQEKWGYAYIGWSGPRFFYIDVFYGDAKDAPVILYETTQRCTYLREDYDYTADEFRIQGTEDVICFGEVLTEASNGPDGFLREKQNMVLTSSTHESLNIELGIHFYDGRWFASSSDFVYFEMSDSLVEILVKNQMIESDES